MLYILLTIFGILLLFGIPTIIYITTSKKYKCVNNDCIQDNSGSFKSLNECEISCSAPPKPPQKYYKCKSGNCIEDPSGNYKSQDECNSRCKVYITLYDSKLNGTQYKTFTGTDAFQTAKDFCSNDINCQGINSKTSDGSAYVVKESTGVSAVYGVSTSITPSSKGKYITQYIYNNKLLTGTEYKETTQFKSNEIDKIMKYCLDDKDAEGYNVKTSDGNCIVTLVKNITGTKISAGYYYGFKWG